MEVAYINKIEEHPNADQLEITKLGEYPCIIRKGQFREGDKVLYIPVDYEVPVDREQFSFLKGNENGTHRIRAKRLRGIFSMGLIIPYTDEDLGVVKWEPPIETDMSITNGRPDLGLWDKYDIENLRKYADAIPLGDPVIITEKIHGACAGYCYHNGELIVKSKRMYRAKDDGDMWWRIAEKYGLEDRLQAFEDYVFFGEIYGNVQKLKYGLGSDIQILFFDIFDREMNEFVGWSEFEEILHEAGLSHVPVLYKGPWLGYNNHVALAEGPSTLWDGHVREGLVVKTIDRKNIYKLHGEGYLV